MDIDVTDTHVLDAAIRAQRDRRERERIDLLNVAERALGAAPITLDEAYLFGSVVTSGRFDLHSDVDIAIHNIGAREFLELKTHLKRELGREVDLIELERCTFGESIRRKGMLWTNPHTRSSHPR